MIEPMGQVYIGGAKQVLKGKGTVKVSLRDVFYTQKVKGSINFENTMATFRNVRDSRVANISFTWRFGKPMKEQRSRKTGGASEELNRIKNGSSS
jgi:iron complex outermembrane recepter protein